MMDFAPYQSSPPENVRTFSPPNPIDGYASPRASLDRPRNHQRPFAGSRPALSNSPPLLHHPQPQRAWSGDSIRASSQPPPMTAQGVGGGGGYQHRGGWMGVAFGGGGAGDDRYELLSEFDTSLGLRLDYEACLGYLMVPPLGAILLLMVEKKSDYVRFHAWQSALLFTAMFVLHLILSWSTTLSWLVFLADMALILFLVKKAYQDADTLDRYEAPVVGPIASRILDDE